jgi:hypothetical protein
MVLRRVHIRPHVNPHRPPPPISGLDRQALRVPACRGRKKKMLGKYCDSGGGGIGANKDDEKKK